MKRVYLDQYAKCACGHELSLHGAKRPCPCRARGCECGGFTQIKRDGTLVLIPLEKP